MRRSRPSVSKKSDENSPMLKSRRRAIKTLALVPLVPSLVTDARLALTQTQTKPAVAPTPSPQTPTPELKPSPEAEAYAEIIKLRYGKYLNEEQLGEIQLGLERGIRGRQRLRAFKLTQADEPATVFSARD